MFCHSYFLSAYCPNDDETDPDGCEGDASGCSKETN